MAQNYQEGKFVSPGRNFAVTEGWWDKSSGDGVWRNAPVEWDDAAAFPAYQKKIKRSLETTKAHLRNVQKYPELDYATTWQHGNPFHSQGLGPANYAGKYTSDTYQDQIRWWEASARKFDLRSKELAAFAAHPGGEEGVAADQSAKKLLGRPFAEGARASELLRSQRVSGTGGGAAQAAGGRQSQGAVRGERRRQAVNSVLAAGGSSPRKRLRAKQLTQQPLGSGNQAASQLLG